MVSFLLCLPSGSAHHTALPPAATRRLRRTITQSRYRRADEAGGPVDVEDGQLPHLVTFSTAAELGSFTGAAKALGLTQAAVSQRIQSLEKTLGKSLFDRRGGRVALTEAGR